MVVFLVILHFPAFAIVISRIYDCPDRRTLLPLGDLLCPSHSFPSSKPCHESLLRVFAALNNNSFRLGSSMWYCEFCSSSAIVYGKESWESSLLVAFRKYSHDLQIAVRARIILVAKEEGRERSKGSNTRVFAGFYPMNELHERMRFYCGLWPAERIG